MKQTSLLFLAAIVLGANAQDHTVDVTSAQILEYKANTSAECAADASRSGLESSQALSFCSCTTDVVWRSMPPGELREAYESSVRGSKTDEMKVLRPYISRAVRECSGSLKP